MNCKRNTSCSHHQYQDRCQTKQLQAAPDCTRPHHHSASDKLQLWIALRDVTSQTRHVCDIIWKLGNFDRYNTDTKPQTPKLKLRLVAPPSKISHHDRSIKISRLPQRQNFLASKFLPVTPVCVHSACIAPHATRDKIKRQYIVPSERKMAALVESSVEHRRYDAGAGIYSIVCVRVQFHLFFFEKQELRLIMEMIAVMLRMIAMINGKLMMKRMVTTMA